ncbi:CPLX4 [Vulpes lagopus]
MAELAVPIIHPNGGLCCCFDYLLGGWLSESGLSLPCLCFAQSEMDENQIQMAGDDVDLPEDLRKMVDEDQEEEEDKDSILGHLQNLQNMDLDTIKEKAQATFTEMKQTAEQKCAVM